MIETSAKCIVMAVSLLTCIAGAAAQTALLAEGFAADPLRIGWTYTGQGSGWNGGQGCLVGQPGALWQSPRFPVTPFRYVRIECTAACGSRAMVACVRVNHATDWGRLLTSTSGELIADDYTAVHAGARHREVYYSRACPNADSAYVRFHPVDSALTVDTVSVRTATSDEARAWADSVYARLIPLHAALPADRLIPLVHTLTLLRSGARVRIVLLGDSIMNDLANSPFDVLLERLFPGCVIEVVAAVNGGAGIDKWNHPELYPGQDLDLNKSVVAQRPDIVVIGGISTPATVAGYDDVRQVVDKVRIGTDAAFGYRPDILVLTGAFGQNANPASASSTWYETIDTSAQDYRTTLWRIAREKQTGFFDLTGVWGRYMLGAQAAGLSYDLFFRDAIHASTEGKQLLARAMVAFFDQPVVAAVARARARVEGLGSRPTMVDLRGRLLVTQRVLAALPRTWQRAPSVRYDGPEEAGTRALRLVTSPYTEFGAR